MSYLEEKTVPIAAHLERITILAAHARIVRTDFQVDGSGRLHGAAQLEKATRRQRVVVPRDNPEQPPRSVLQCISTFFGIPETKAAEIYQAILAIARINPRGAWCLTPDREPERSLVDEGAERFVIDLATSLSECMPQVGRIEADTFQQPTSRGHMQRRTFLRVQDRSGQEVAALDTAHFPKHIRTMVLAGEEHHDVNRSRAADWATQIGAELEEMPLILNDLHALFFKIGLNHVDFRDGAVG